MWGMLVRATGGMSLIEGGRCPDGAVAAVWGSIPVLTMGGWRRVEMADRRLAQLPACAVRSGCRVPTIVMLLSHRAHVVLVAAV